MVKLRSALVMMGVSAVMLLCATSAFARGGGRGGGRGGQGGMQQPPAEKPELTEDRKQITTLTTTLNTAKQAYDSALKKFTDEFAKQPDYADAQKALDAANKAADAAHDAVLAKLKSSSAEYKAAVAKSAAAQAKLDQIRAANGSKQAVSDQAMVKFTADQDIDKLERAALDKDDAYQEAKKNAVTAAAALKAEKDKLAEAVKGDANLTTLAQAKDDATAKLDEAKKKLQTDLAAK